MANVHSDPCFIFGPKGGKEVCTRTCGLSSITALANQGASFEAIAAQSRSTPGISINTQTPANRLELGCSELSLTGLRIRGKVKTGDIFVQGEATFTK